MTSLKLSGDTRGAQQCVIERRFRAQARGRRGIRTVFRHRAHIRGACPCGSGRGHAIKVRARGVVQTHGKLEGCQALQAGREPIDGVVLVATSCDRLRSFRSRERGVHLLGRLDVDSRQFPAAQLAATVSTLMHYSASMRSRRFARTTRTSVVGASFFVAVIAKSGLDREPIVAGRSRTKRRQRRGAAFTSSVPRP